MALFLGGAIDSLVFYKIKCPDKIRAKVGQNLGHHSGKPRTKLGQTSDIIRANLGQNSGKPRTKFGQTLDMNWDNISDDVQFQIRKRVLSGIMSEVCPNFVRGLPKICPSLA